MTAREPLLNQVAIADLRPTQVTVGMVEVAAKRKAWRDKHGGGDPGKEAAFLDRHMIPVIAGPKGRSYVIDHHHLARALLDEGVTHVRVTVVGDLAGLGAEEFWAVMDMRSWMHPFDAEGVRQAANAIPKSIAGLVDDPFRSLAGELRRQGGYAKDTTPFSEFLWADFLRRRIRRRDVEKDFHAAVATALGLTRDAEAAHLPGWCGPVPR